MTIPPEPSEPTPTHERPGGSGDDTAFLSLSLGVLIAQLPVILWTVDSSFRFTSSAGGGLTAIGLEPGHGVGMTVKEYFGNDDPELRPLAAIRDALAGSVARYEESRFGRTYEVWVGPLRETGGDITGAIGLALDVTERKRIEGQLVHQAFHDGLTDLANRALFHDRVQHALARAGRGEHVAVLFLDLDDFKAVNDSLGHADGDTLLRAVADRLRAATRGFDTVARLGGDEFAVLLEGMASRGEVDPVVSRLTRALAAPFPLRGRDVTVRASIGVAHSTDLSGGATADELLRNADVAMYRAKAMGKGRHAVFEPAMHAAVIERLELEAELRRAVRRPADHGLRLVYQPVFDLRTFRLAGFEALVRWEHPARGLVSPAAFVPVAEETGLIVAMGRWALSDACRELRRWEERLPPWRPERRAPTMAINLSGRQLEDDVLVYDLAAVLRESGVTPQRVTLEITESAIMRNTEATLARLHALKGLGVRLAIDDFGTGYSSLAYLQRFPVDVIKIDKAFVDGVTRGGASGSGHDAALVRTIVALSDTLALATVAEGIEREEQREVLAALGCRYGQGYLFSEPLLPADADALVDQLAAELASGGRRSRAHA